MKAHTEGVAVVGTYDFETAETYCAGLKAKGLSADIIPVEGEWHDDIRASPEMRSFSISGVVEMVTRCQSCIKISRVILAHQVGRPSPDPLQKAGNSTVSGAEKCAGFGKCNTISQM